MKAMNARALLLVTIALGLAGFAAPACTETGSANDAGPGEGSDPGCCPTTKSGCTVLRYGKKTSPNDTCVVGFDGIVPDPSADGWVLQKLPDGCEGWVAPKNVPTLVCGTRPPVDATPPPDDATTPDATPDAPNDTGPDSAPDAAADAPTDG
jgi:hypothetical protein